MDIVVCINPLCRKPENVHGSKYCQNCGNPIPNLLLNRFKILKSLGRGGCGKTYLAQDSHKLNSPCVVKQLIPNHEHYDRVLKLFRREAQQLEKLGENPRIPQLIAYFQEKNYFYLVQEYIQGEDLAAELAKQGVWNEEKIRQLLGELLPVLQFIHDNGVVHRDLKPANIMRRHVNKALAKKGNLVLIDFGASRDVQQTVAFTVAGTPGYYPKEQRELGEAYPASDLYSLAATCVNLLSNQFPQTLFSLYKGYGWTKNYHKHIKQPISDNLTQVLDKSLREKHIERYLSAREVIQALQVSAPQQPIAPTVLPKTSPPSNSTPKNTPHSSPQQNISSTVLPSKKPSSPSQTRRLSIPTLNFDEPVQPPPKNKSKPKKKSGLKTFEFTTVKVNNRGEIIEQKNQQAHYFTEKLRNSITLDMVEIPGGKFMMGTEDEEIKKLVKNYNRNWYRWEKPQHQVTLKPFFMGKYPVTQAQWQAVANQTKINRDLKPDPARFKGNNRPVETVSWLDAVEFCARLSKSTGKEYTLPSEAQWEYACRAETTTPFYFGETITSKLANYNGTRIYANEPKGEDRHETTPVGSFPPNAFGLYDMHGNVWEWCADTRHDSYEGAPTDGSAWIDKDIDNNNEFKRLLRGGSWFNYPVNCRSATRGNNNPDYRNITVGFRVCCGIPRSLE